MRKKILIANRGEIAIRIAVALKELDFESFGLWTDDEPSGNHLRFIENWIHLSGSNIQETYLNAKKIVNIAKEHDIDGIHPGYGLLSENYHFAKLCEESGLVFIGPHSNAIKMLGDKSESKKLAKKFNVPTIPGSDENINSIEEAKKLADQIGYPVLLKAVSGGGGRGMRICESENDLEKNIESVKREAKSSFNDDRLLLEKFVNSPRHIEVQVLSDKKGNHFHFFERECSIQRRHQKVVEEAPSAFVDSELRRKMTEAALRFSKGIKYDSAGTVEFVVDNKKNFYFLEMNTRIQVEHAISEEVTGHDLMVNMIKVAFEQALDFTDQKEILLQKHAIELRVCAEDPKTFLPATGRIHTLKKLSFPGVRYDFTVTEGSRVGTHYDSMIGKVIAYGKNRDIAIRKIRLAINSLVIRGVVTNIPLLQKVVHDDDYVNNKITTKFLEEKQYDLEDLNENDILALVGLQEVLDYKEV